MPPLHRQLCRHGTPPPPAEPTFPGLWPDGMAELGFLQPAWTPLLALCRPQPWQGGLMEEAFHSLKNRSKNCVQDLYRNLSQTIHTDSTFAHEQQGAAAPRFRARAVEAAWPTLSKWPGHVHTRESRASLLAAPFKAEESFLPASSSMEGNQRRGRAV